MAFVYNIAVFKFGPITHAGQSLSTQASFTQVGTFVHLRQGATAFEDQPPAVLGLHVIVDLPAATVATGRTIVFRLRDTTNSLTLVTATYAVSIGFNGTERPAQWVGSFDFSNLPSGDALIELQYTWVHPDSTAATMHLAAWDYTRAP